MNNDEFITEGLKHYPEAMRAVIYFEDSVLEIIQKSLQRILSERPSNDYWKCQEKPVKERSRSASDPYMGCTAKGKMNTSDSAVLECGIWWVRSGCLVYAGFRSGPEWARQELQPRKGSIIRTEEGASVYFAMDLKTAKEIEPKLKQVITELLSVAKR